MRSLKIGLLFALATASPALAKDKDAPATMPPVYQAVVDCREIADPAQRLACFDRTVGAMTSATTEKDLVVLDRATMRETRKGLFGFSLPKLKLFGDGEEDVRDEVKEIEAGITGIGGSSDGFPIFVLDDGGRWKQTDGRNIFARVGERMKIKRGTLGSYMASVGKRTGIRVVRLTN